MEFKTKFDYKIYIVNIMCQKALLHISMQEICSFSHFRLVTMCVKNCPNFCSVYRQPLSGARTDPLSSRILQNGRNLLQWECMSSENQGRLLHQRRVKPSACPCFTCPSLGLSPFCLGTSKQGRISGPTLLLLKGVATSNPKLLFHENNISFISKRNTDIQRNSSCIGLLGLCP